MAVNSQQTLRMAHGRQSLQARIVPMDILRQQLHSRLMLLTTHMEISLTQLHTLNHIPQMKRARPHHIGHSTRMQSIQPLTAPLMRLPQQLHTLMHQLRVSLHPLTTGTLLTTDMKVMETPTITLRLDIRQQTA